MRHCTILNCIVLNMYVNTRTMHIQYMETHTHTHIHTHKHNAWQTNKQTQSHTLSQARVTCIKEWTVPKQKTNTACLHLHWHFVLLGTKQWHVFIWIWMGFESVLGVKEPNNREQPWVTLTDKSPFVILTSGFSHQFISLPISSTSPSPPLSSPWSRSRPGINGRRLR